MKRRACILACLLALASTFAGGARAEVWIHVDTQALTLTVMDGATPLARFEDISLGRGGVSRARHAGDDTTPLGEFHIAWINRNSPFGIFYGFDYPNLDYARDALERGQIDRRTYERIRTAIAQHRTPPQNTPLGGMLGIHGLGNANPRIHREFHWTQGCIALTNEQIRALDRWIELGTRVVVE